MRLLLRLCFFCLLPCSLAHSAATVNYARPLHRTDLFLAVPYQSRTVLVLFSDEGNAPGTPHAGQPLAHPMSPLSLSGIVHGRLTAVANASEKISWYADWPPNGAPAPRIGDRFKIALGGAIKVTATLTQLAFLPTCHATWIVGVATLDASDPAAHAATASGSQAIFLAQPVSSGPIGGTSPANAPMDGQGRMAVSTGLPEIGSAVASSMSEIGPLIFSIGSDALLSPEARRKIEQALNQQMEADYSATLGQRQALYQQTHPTPFAEVVGNSALLQGKAMLVYSMQQVAVAEGTERYYVQAQWRSGRKNVYLVRAWFTPAFALESTTDSGVPEGEAARNIEGNAALAIRNIEKGRGRTVGIAGSKTGREPVGPSSDILNVFDASLVHVTETVGLIELPQPGNLILMRQGGLVGLRYVLLRWTPGGLLPAGVYFSMGC